MMLMNSTPQTSVQKWLIEHAMCFRVIGIFIACCSAAVPSWLVWMRYRAERPDPEVAKLVAGARAAFPGTLPVPHLEKFGHLKFTIEKSIDVEFNCVERKLIQPHSKAYQQSEYDKRLRVRKIRYDDSWEYWYYPERMKYFCIFRVRTIFNHLSEDQVRTALDACIGSYQKALQSVILDSE